MRTRGARPFRAVLVGALVLAQLQTFAAGAGAAPEPAPSHTPLAAGPSANVLVYGGTPSGVVAAVAVRRQGAASVLLLEPTAHIGGMMTSGLNATDTGDKSVIGGIAREFFSRMQVIEGSSQGRYAFQSRNAEKVFKAMLAEAGVEVRLSTRLSEGDDAVIMAGNRIVAVTTSAGERLSATVFVDASYEGDLMAATGVSYLVGREAPQQYGEPFAGVLESRGLVAGVGHLSLGFPTASPGPVGSADGRIQASNFRVCFSSDPANQVPFPKPAGYNAAHYEIVLGYFEVLRPVHGTPRLAWVLSVAPLVNSKFDVNDYGAMSIAVPGANYEYPDGSYAERAEIAAWHRGYAQGFFYFLRNDPRVPSSVRAEMAGYGLCRDEFTDNANWPHQLYLREGRRMVGDQVLTSHDVQAIRSKPDIVATGSYKMDAHYVSRFLDVGGNLRVEGMFWSDKRVNYALPYSVMLPREEEAANLLVPVTSSASHVAQSAVRMEPEYMMLGEAAGTAAALAVSSSQPVQDVRVSTLQERLRAGGAVLTDPGDIGSSIFYWDIVWAYHAGITSGCAEGRFCPTAVVTREMMAAFLARALKLPPASRDHFTDDEASPFEESINRLADAGITRGCTTTKYCPAADVTRDQMASFLVRAFRFPVTSTDYFTDDAGSIHQSDINRLAAARITSGCAATLYCPSRAVTRGEMLAFLHRALR